MADIKVLHLNVKGIYFDAYVDGTKKEEYRLVTDFWKKRLVDRHYDVIKYKKGYPSSDDESRTKILPYNGYEIKTITHEHFGDEPVEVFAIRLV
jgi:hypothetical protein